MVSRLGTLLYETMNASMNVVPGTKLGRYEIRSPPNHGRPELDEGFAGELSYLIQPVDLRRRNAWH